MQGFLDCVGGLLPPPRGAQDPLPCNGVNRTATHGGGSKAGRDPPAPCPGILCGWALLPRVGEEKPEGPDWAQGRCWAYQGTWEDSSGVSEL